jgi:hypothetical protein
LPDRAEQRPAAGHRDTTALWQVIDTIRDYFYRYPFNLLKALFLIIEYCEAAIVIKQILTSHDDDRITLLQAGDQPAERVIISFGGQPSDLSDVGFSSRFALENDWDNIFVAQRHGTQCQGLPLETFRDTVLPIIADREYLSYGVGLGGYCALYYGGAIDARVLAAPPMLPDWRPLNILFYADLPMTHAELWDLPHASRPLVVMFDPERPPDQFLVTHMVLPTYPQARLVRIPFGGHAVLLALAKLGCFKPMMMGIIEHDEIIAFDPPDSQHSVSHVENARKKMEIDTAIGHLRTSLAIRPTRH